MPPAVTALPIVGAVVPELIVTERDLRRLASSSPQTTLPLFTETQDTLPTVFVTAADVVRVLKVAVLPVQSMCIALSFLVWVFIVTTAN